MANPKRRFSKARKRLRRTHYKLSPVGLIECPQCREVKLPHRICGNCGHYKGRTAEVKEEI